MVINSLFFCHTHTHTHTVEDSSSMFQSFDRPQQSCVIRADVNLGGDQ